MDERDWLAERFEAQRSHLRAVAYRMLGSMSEADDTVQEAWLRLSRADTTSVRPGYRNDFLVRTRICLLPSRLFVPKMRREAIGRTGSVDVSTPL